MNRVWVRFGPPLVALRGVAGSRALRRTSIAFLIFSGAESEKRPAGALFAGGKGKKVIAAARLPARLVRAYLHTTPGELCELWRHTVLGHLQAGTLGYNGHLANGLAALSIACGQDVANVSESSAGIVYTEVTPNHDLYISITIPSLIVATHGGGTSLPTQRECLDILGCTGRNKVRKFAEIVASVVLAGEISLASAISSLDWVSSHEKYGRNR